MDDDVAVRARTEEDLDACHAIAIEVHELDGYPNFLGDGDLRRFLQPDDTIGAWVAELDGEVAGQVVLRTSSAPQSADLAAVRIGVGRDELAFIARLLVAPRARRRGCATSLLDVAVRRARDLGKVPVLDVIQKDRKAIALYDALGWQRLGEQHVTSRDGTREFHLAVYAAPG